MQTGYSYPAPQQKKHGALTAVLIVLVALLAAAFVLSWLALSDPYAGAGLENIQPSDALPKTLAASALTGKECSFSTGEVNSFLSYLYRRDDGGKDHGGMRLQTVAVAGASGADADFYLPVTVWGKRFGVTMNVTPSLNSETGKLEFRVNSAHVGRLPVPADWLLEKAENRLPDGFTRDGNIVSCSVPSLGASLLHLSASVGLGRFTLDNGTLTLGVNARINVD